MWALIITLIIIGLILLIAELIIIPGFGIAGISGVIAMIASCFLAFSKFGAVAGAIVVGANVLLVVITTLLVLRSRTWKKASLDTVIEAKVDETPSDKGIEKGQRGIALTRLAPGGQIRINGIITEAFTHDSIIEAQSNVEVVQISDNKIFIKKV